MTRALPTRVEAAPKQLLGRAQLLAARARGAGIAVAVDQLAAFLTGLDLLGVTDRPALHRLATTTLAGRASDVSLLRDLVDATFPAAVDDEPGSRRPATAAGSAGELRDDLFAALRSGDVDAAFRLGADAAGLATSLGGGRPGSVRYAEQRILRALDLSDLIRRAMVGTAARDSLERGLAQAERDDAMQAFGRGLVGELRRQTARLEIDGRTGHDNQFDDPLDADLLTISPREAAELAALIRPLARRLAARARRRRRLRHGQLDIRLTQRAALATGGVPLAPVMRRRRPSRPKLVTICDVSGSMSDHARFLLALVDEMARQLPRLRTFVFVDGIAEVTDLVAGRGAAVDVKALLAAPGVVVGDGHSAYGDVLASFTQRYCPDLAADSTVVVLGDARTRGHDPRAEQLGAISRKVRQLWWLNPEPVADWDTGDSRMSAYRPHCTGVAEVRTLRQLGEWIQSLM